MEYTVVVLPQPVSPTMLTRSRLCTLKCAEGDMQVLYIYDQITFLFLHRAFLPYSVSDSISLIPSPVRLKPSTISIMAKAGNTDSHH